MNRIQLETLLHEQIPLAKAMNVKVEYFDSGRVELTCPLTPNHNHLGTAFGGSLSALMILAAYCRLFAIINGKGHVLLKSNSMQFLKPVHEDLRAISIPPDQEASDIFLKTYQKKKRARITLISEILLSDASVACRMTGEFIGCDI